MHLEKSCRSIVKHSMNASEESHDKVVILNPASIPIIQAITSAVVVDT